MTVHFVGAGPGAADLLTLRAAALLAAADVCLYAGTYLDDGVLEHCRPEARLVDTQHLDLDGIIAEIVAAHASGLEVVRLCSGDPSIYSALAEQTRRLDAAGVPWAVVPGVPAYAAAAAELGVELTVPEVVQSVVLTRVQARSTAMPSTEALENFAATGATLVLHLAITRIRELAERLVPTHGADCPVVVVANASRPHRVELRGTLADIADAVEAAGLRQGGVALEGGAQEFVVGAGIRVGVAEEAQHDVADLQHRVLVRAGLVGEQAGHESAEPVGAQVDDGLVLGVEVVEERARGDVGAGGDRLHHGGLQAFLGRRLEGGECQRGPGARLLRLAQARRGYGCVGGVGAVGGIRAVSGRGIGVRRTMMLPFCSQCKFARSAEF